MATTYGMQGISSGRRERKFVRKLWDMNWGLILLLSLIAGVGVAMLYSVSKDWEPYAVRHATRYAAALGLLVAVAMIDIRIWMRLAYPAYAVALLLLVAVEFFGTVGMGAQRWIDLGPLVLQPSEIMKITLVLALARYFHDIRVEDVSRPLYLLGPLFLIAAPVLLVVKQPDLGTSVLLGAGGFAIWFLAGLKWRWIVPALAAGVAAIPIAWQFLHPYQQARVMTFLDPSRDPLGAGYHITQSKIALGSGGIGGKGYLEGTQSQLNFLPEKQTDFIFTMLAEEMGLIGAVGLLGLYLLVLAAGVQIALSSANHFGRLVAMGVCVTLVLYIVINVSMVTGLIPVVGVPLPLVSHGGTSMMTIMFGMGLLMSVHVHRHIEVGRGGPGHW